MINFLVHAWFVWIRRCGYMPDGNYLAVAEFSAGIRQRVEIVHFDGKGYYIRFVEREVVE